MLCGRYRLDLLPTVIPRDSRPLDDPGLLGRLLDRAKASGWDGYRIDLSGLSVSARDRWLEAIDPWQRSYHHAGMRLVIATDNEKGAAR